jgi:hypothetical protein
MKGKPRFKAPNYSRGCLLAKAFGVSAANSARGCAVHLVIPDSSIHSRLFRVALRYNTPPKSRSRAPVHLVVPNSSIVS